MSALTSSISWGMTSLSFSLSVVSAHCNQVNNASNSSWLAISAARAPANLCWCCFAHANTLKRKVCMIFTFTQPRALGAPLLSHEQIWQNYQRTAEQPHWWALWVEAGTLCTPWREVQKEKSLPFYCDPKVSRSTEVLESTAVFNDWVFSVVTFWELSHNTP